MPARSSDCRLNDPWYFASTGRKFGLGAATWIDRCASSLVFLGKDGYTNFHLDPAEALNLAFAVVKKVRV